MTAFTFDPNLDEDPMGSGDEPTAFDDDQYSAPWPPMVRDDEPWGPDAGATTAEYAITTLAACGFAALLVVVLKSEPIRELVTGVIQTALGLGS
ncbi:DUF4244 domain-containing protein [Brevibacterium sp.]|uniref:DUF4244 domain-containing protein n=1 Tax=Brevibacterium sp. TaxID=1701 RepID=UPI0028116BAB|nr:DUF4244 domain-containing protein [Brevibacterium sp.]